jgi:membrane fusion protein, multidrug efflux system
MRIFGNRTAVSLIAIAAIGWCHSALAQKGPPVVTVATPLARNVAQWGEYTGRFEASERVTLRARVSGYIDRVHFADGADVKQGDLLFTIDRRPFEITVESARGDVARAQAQLTLGQVDYQRALETRRADVSRRKRASYHYMRSGEKRGLKRCVRLNTTNWRR